MFRSRRASTSQKGAPTSGAHRSGTTTNLAGASDGYASRLRECLDIIGGRNLELRALTTIDAGNAMRTALRLDRERSVAAGAPLVVAVADNIDVLGMATTIGSRYVQDSVPAADAEVTRRLRAAHCIVVAKASMDAFGLGALSPGAHDGGCRNPWEPRRSPGGSSGGASAAVASGMCDAALGTGAGGSVCVSAALNGVVGLRPTPGRISRRGVATQSPSFDVVGALARTAETAARLYVAVAGHDADDPESADRPVEPLPAACEAPLCGARIAVPEDPFLDYAEAEVRAAVRRGASVLRHFGAVTSAPAIFHARRTHDALTRIVRAEVATTHRELLDRDPQFLGSNVWTQLRDSLPATPEDYAQASAIGAEWRAQIFRLFDEVDYILTPTVGFSAPPIRGPGEMFAKIHALTRMTLAWACAGLPAISIPCGFTSDGLPIGMQLIGRPWSEADLLAIACAFQAVTDHHLRGPPPRAAP